MKSLATTVLLLVLAVMPIDVAVAEESRAKPISSTMLTDSESGTATEIEHKTPRTSALDLSLFGIIALGVLGLFWIRRHTSEL
jgi:hypothetical protein